MTQAKIQGKFYPLQHEEWLRACRELTPAQRDVLYYIRTLDPHNNGIEINAAEIARQLSSPEREVHRQTVSRALKELDSKGFVDLELLLVRAKVKPKGLWCDETPKVCGDTKGAMRHQGCDETPRSIATHRDRSPDTIVDRDAPSVIATHQPEAESTVQSESQLSKINKNYSDFIKTLSENERENFWEFGIEKAKKLPKPPELPLKWIEVHWQELRSQWEKTEAGRAAISSQIDWTQYPEWEDWLAQMREGVPRFVAFGTCFDNKTRRVIADWADERGLIWGTET